MSISREITDFLRSTRYRVADLALEAGVSRELVGMLKRRVKLTCSEASAERIRSGMRRLYKQWRIQEGCGNG